jgi:hypothetical protein
MLSIVRKMSIFRVSGLKKPIGGRYMARIKSAWELALEKTKDIEIDESKYKAGVLEKDSMALAGKYLNDAQMTDEELAGKYNSYTSEELTSVKKGIVNTIFSNLGLPQDNLYEMRFERLVALVVLIADQGSQAVSSIRQIGDLFAQYIKHREDFIQRMQEQVQQAMQENPEGFNSKQYTQLIQQNLKKLDAQYQGALDNAKEALKEQLA